ncbi:putative Na/Pi-cotransporter II-like protein [Magnetofaba australis IT-1]|uniref:Putative Na/Pi-cotransporter II-like protein n=2 Tax=Magnetofaba TaxID=1472292 RepID=A0A1Y2K3F0_9PROT|nr:putative Na/Pi-cotransporter II-like protein [Magnetofaba australis IT-1]
MWAADSEEVSIAWGSMAMGLFGGLALFLFGMEMMASALKAVAGDRMKAILAKLTSNRLSGAMTGAAVTAVIQSSSVTTVLVVGFISAGLMTLSQAVGVIFGANIGTTITAQIVAFKVTKASFLMIAVGFGLNAMGKRDQIRQYGAMIMGLGLIFLGMTIMSDAMKPLRSYQPFLDLMIHMESPWLGIVVAAAFTGLVQSSSATTGIVIVMASQGFITLPAGIALAFGANIGTCVTALLASIGKPREAVRAALAHVLFNVFGVLIWVGLIDQLASAVAMISPSAPADVTGIAKLAAESPRQIANAHTLFNIVNTIIFLPFTGPFAWLILKLLPEKRVVESVSPDETPVFKPLYLEEALVTTPALAMEAARREFKGMGMRCGLMLNDAFPVVMRGDKPQLKLFKKRDEEIDAYYEGIIAYLGNVSRGNLTSLQTRELISLVSAVDTVENIGDIVETNLVHLGRQRVKGNLAVDEQTESFLRSVHALVMESMETAIRAFTERDEPAVRRVMAIEKELEALIASSSMRHLKQAGAANQMLGSFSFVRDMLDKLRRVYSFSKALARLAVDAIEIQEELDGVVTETGILEEIEAAEEANDDLEENAAA